MAVSRSTPRARMARRNTRVAAAVGLVEHSTASTPAHMLDNPNRGKHGAARLDITGERAERTMRAARRDYRPLTVHTPILRARKSPNTTSYTI